MRRFVFAAAIAAVFVCGSAWAGSGGTIVKHHLQWVVENENNPATALSVPQGVWTPVDASTVINCASDTGCLITADTSIQANADGGDPNRAALCTYIDGKPMRSNCPLTVEVWGNDPVTVTKRDSAVVTMGKHHVQTMVFVQITAMSFGWYQFDYSVWSP